MTETPGYFPSSGGATLYGVLHAPDAASAVPALIAPSLFEERKSAYAALARLARALCAAGHPVLRFDYRGSGESSFDSARERTFADLGEDLRAAAEALRKASGSEKLALVGLRWGASLALKHADELKAEQIVALAPVVSGKTEERRWRLRSKIRAELTAGEGAAAPNKGGEGGAGSGGYDFDGYALSAEFVAGAQALDLLALGQAPCPVSLVQLAVKAEPTAESRKLAEALGAKATLQGLAMEAFWDRIDDVETAPLHDVVLSLLA